jgi:hypothetical protein
MSEQERLDDERIERIVVVYELPPSPQGTYQYEREGGTVVHGDASGEWALDDAGEVEDIVFFASPRSMGYGRKKTE